MTPREIVWQSLRFQTPPRLRDLPEPWGSDFASVSMDASPDSRPRGGKGTDEWGAVWDNIGVCQLGEVQHVPLPRWEDWPKLHIPDIHEPRRWKSIATAQQHAGDKFLLANGISIYERVHFIRGLENTWIDIHENPDQLCRLIDILTDMNLMAIEKYRAAGADGFIFCDDWGLQNRLMIDPAQWRQIWKPRYARIFAAAHAANMATFLHSCGYIVDILDDLIEIGLDAVHMDQQENMGLSLLGHRFAGRITFFAPVDIQTAMHHGQHAIRAYAREMARHLLWQDGPRAGGWIPRWYTDPKGAGHSQDAIDTMCDEFSRISQELFGS